MSAANDNWVFCKIAGTVVMTEKAREEAFRLRPVTIHSEKIATAAGDASLEVVHTPKFNCYRMNCISKHGFVLAFLDFEAESDAIWYLPVMRERIAQAKQFPI